MDSLSQLFLTVIPVSRTDGQTERANRVVEDILRSVCAETPKRWSAMLPVVEFAMNNAVHASTGFTPFYVNGLTHPRVPLTPSRRVSGLDGGDVKWLADVSSTAVQKQVDDFLSLRLSVLRHVRDAMAESQDVQNEQADARVSAVFKTKLRPRFIGPFKVVAKKGLAYTLNLPKKMRTHPVFYVGLLKPYRDPSQVNLTMQTSDQVAQPNIRALQSHHAVCLLVPKSLNAQRGLVCDLVDMVFSLLQIVKPEYEQPSDRSTAEWKTNDLKALGVIAGDKVKNRLIVTKKLNNFKMEPGTRVATHVDQFKEIVLRTETIGEPLDEPPARVVPCKEEKFWGKHRFGGKCFYCKKQGHKEFECRKKKSDEECGQVAQEQRLDFAFTATSAMSKSVWLVDSGASSHMTSVRDKFVSMKYLKTPVRINIADGTKIGAVATGTVSLKLMDGTTVSLSYVLYIPEVEGSLISVSKLVEKSAVAQFSKAKCVFRYGDARVMEAMRCGNVYKLKRVGGETLYEIVYKPKPQLKNFKVFGALGYAHIPNEKRRKLDAKAFKYRFMGYEDGVKGNRVMNVTTGKVQIVRTVKFMETSTSGHLKLEHPPHYETEDPEEASVRKKQSVICKPMPHNNRLPS
ncbi:Pol protein putative [Phytophthora palmivora]|uniref:Pol protein putative n=1 Tax=Phytophthora palmivora TaxID=4796 RepID=A0A2P4WZF2_9STRA|nr:Pol protein putative [Phytophthora palmivora]